MNKYTSLSGLGKLPVDKNHFVSIVEKDIKSFFPEVCPFKDHSKDNKWIIDIDPVRQFKFGWNSQIRRFMVWANTFEDAKVGRQIIYRLFDSKYPGLIETVRRQWDVSAKEVSGL